MMTVPYIEYLNVRIKGYRSRLFTRDTYDNILAGDTLGAFTTFLLDKPWYHDSVKAGLESLPEREGLEQGVTRHFAESVSGILHMAGESIGELFGIALYPFDIRNLRTIILAYIREVPAGRVRSMLVPAGAIDVEVMTALLRVERIEDMPHILEKCCPHGARALETTLRETESLTPAVNVINRLEKHLYGDILSYLQSPKHNRRVLLDIFRSDIDLKNITAALKFVWENGGTMENTREAFIPGGTISMRFLGETAASKTLDEALEKLERTHFHEAIEKGIIYYAETGFFHEMERFFEEVFIRRTQSVKRLNPFGIGVFVSYVWAQYVELTNLRTIINGIAYRSGAGQIRKGLIHV